MSRTVRNHISNRMNFGMVYNRVRTIDLSKTKVKRSSERSETDVLKYEPNRRKAKRPIRFQPEQTYNLDDYLSDIENGASESDTFDVPNFFEAYDVY